METHSVSISMYWVKLKQSLFSTCKLFLNIFNSSNISDFTPHGLNSSKVELKDPQVKTRASIQASEYRSGWIKGNMFETWLVHWVTLLIYSAFRTIQYSGKYHPLHECSGFQLNRSYRIHLCQFKNHTSLALELFIL